MLLAPEFEGEVKLTLEMVIDGAGHRDAPGLAQLLQACGDVHPVAIDVAINQRDIAQVDADPEHDPLGVRQPGVALRDCRLDRHGAGHGIDDALEHQERAIAHQLDDPAVMARDQRVDEFGTDSLEPGDGPRLVGLHHPRVAHDIGRDDRKQATLQRTFRHRRPSQTGAGLASGAEWHQRLQTSTVTGSVHIESPGNCI